MSSKGFLLVHKNEWKRIARKQNNTENAQTKEDYLKCLNEMSQSWMKSWPDTVQKKLQDEANLLEQKKPQWSSLESAADMEKNENEIKRQQRERNIEVARINKAMCNKRKEIEIYKKQKEITSQMEDRRAIHDMDIIEAKEMTIKEQCNNSNTTIVYKQIQNIQDEAQKRFDKFIEIGIERLEKG
ncbi:unnamed protein product [Colias eurytheme]|nr:unnamed protein product [Colias eurytheme]